MNYLDENPHGSPPVLMLHGLGADASSWTHQIIALNKAGFRPIAVDLPGFGATQFNGKWTLRLAAHESVRLMDSLSEPSYCVVGISMGGVIAQILATDYPLRVKKVVLINTFACLRPQRVNEYFYLAKRLFLAYLKGVEYQADSVAWRLFPEPEQEDLRKEIVQRILKSNRSVYRAAMIQLGAFDSRKWIKKLVSPTLVISGELDTTVPMKNQIDLVRRIPGGQHIVIANARHAAIVDQPDTLNKALIGFLASSAADNR